MKVHLSFRRLKSFYRRIDIRTDDECWRWIGKVQSRTRGYLTVDGKRWLAHRLMYAITFDDPGSYVVRHTCDTPNCCNPNHMILGTQLDNIKDRQDRNRQTRGANHPKAKLTVDDVKTIRDLAMQGISQKTLATQFNIGVRQISYIVKRENWKHID